MPSFAPTADGEVSTTCVARTPTLRSAGPLVVGSPRSGAQTGEVLVAELAFGALVFGGVLVLPAP